MLTKKILILTANPKDTSRLQLDQEVSQIEKGLERSQRREQFDIISRWAVRSDDLRRSLLDLEPEILHFSGHGGGAEGLLFASETGKAKLASAEALANLFALFEGKIECVILNACYDRSSGSTTELPGRFPRFSEDGRWIAVALPSERITHLYDANGTLLAQFPGVNPVFIPNSNELITYIDEDTYRIWDIDNGLDDLIAKGCTCLEDYFNTHPEEYLEVCDQV